MTLLRFNPFPVIDPTASFSELRSDVARLLGPSFGRNFNRSLLPAGNSAPGAVDLYQTSDGFVFRAELPGTQKDAIGLEAANGYLKVTVRQPAPKSQEATEPAKSQARPAFERALPLPKQVDVTRIAANYQDGVLTVTLPLREETKPRVIAVEVK